MTRIGLMLRLYMAATGETQELIAFKLKIGGSHLSLIMSGRRRLGEKKEKEFLRWLYEGIGE